VGFPREGGDILGEKTSNKQRFGERNPPEGGRFGGVWNHKEKRDGRGVRKNKGVYRGGGKLVLFISGGVQKGGTICVGQQKMGQIVTGGLVECGQNVKLTKFWGWWGWGKGGQRRKGG